MMKTEFLTTVAIAVRSMTYRELMELASEVSGDADHIIELADKYILPTDGTKPNG